jgi:hypothetical protein
VFDRGGKRKTTIDVLMFDPFAAQVSTLRARLAKPWLAQRCTSVLKAAKLQGPLRSSPLGGVRQNVADALGQCVRQPPPVGDQPPGCLGGSSVAPARPLVKLSSAAGRPSAHTTNKVVGGTWVGLVYGSAKVGEPRRRPSGVG